jgi:putative exosortase-associated protein (TIGR04073 family)
MMFKSNRTLSAALLAFCVYAPIGHAEGYVSDVSSKFTRGAANLFTGIVEVPKNIVYVSEKTNPVAGGPGGLVLGTLHTLGRTATGIFDVITSPIPTESLVQAEYVWEDFEQPTTYFNSKK